MLGAWGALDPGRGAAYKGCGRPGLEDPQSCHLCRFPECPSRSSRAAFSSLSLPIHTGEEPSPEELETWFEGTVRSWQDHAL